MEKVIFKEEQQFRQGWVWFILVAMLVPVFFESRELLKLIKNDSENLYGLSFSLAILLTVIVVFIWLFKTMKLIVEIRKDGIWYRFPPLIRKWRTISKAEIYNYEVLQYKPIVEYGGWGIKKRFDKAAYNVSGNKGLQLYLNNGKRVLFGTQRTDAIKAAMDKLMK